MRDIHILNNFLWGWELAFQREGLLYGQGTFLATVATSIASEARAALNAAWYWKALCEWQLAHFVAEAVGLAWLIPDPPQPPPAPAQPGPEAGTQRRRRQRPRLFARPLGRHLPSLPPASPATTLHYTAVAEGGICLALLAVLLRPKLGWAAV